MGQNATNGTKCDKSKFAPKLQHEHKELIILRLAEFVQTPEIVKELAQTYQIEITERGVLWYSANRKEDIRKKREWLNTHLEDHIPLANKTLRVKMLAKDLRSLEGADDLDSLKVKRELLEQIRKEKEGLKVDVTKKETWTPDQFKHLHSTEDLDRAIKEAEKKDGEVMTVAQVLEEGKE